MTAMIVRITLDQASFNSPHFTQTLKRLNQLITEHIQIPVHSCTHHHILTIRANFAASLFKQNKLPKTIPNTELMPQQKNNETNELTKRHAHFLMQLTKPTNPNQATKPETATTTDEEDTNTIEKNNKRTQTTKWSHPLLFYTTTVPLIGLMLLLKNTRAEEIAPTANNHLSIPLYYLRNQMDDEETQNKPNSGIKNNIVFNWHGQAIINPTIHYYSMTYQACDIHILTKHLRKMIVYHHRLCRQPQVPTTEQFHLISAQDEHHILIKQKMNIIQARQTCNSLNAKLIEVRNKTETKLLDSFMTNHGIRETFSGMYYDHELHEILFSNGDYVNDKNSKDAPELFDGYSHQSKSWATLYDKISKYNQYKPIFTYSKANTANIVTVCSLQQGGYAPNNHARQYTSAHLFPICATPKATHTRDIIYKQWQNQCNATLANLEIKAKATFERIERLKPSAIPTTEQIKLFGNYNSILFPKNQTHERSLDMTQMTKLCRSHRMTMDSSRRVNQMSNGRTKRSILDLAPVTETVFSAIQFISKLYNDYHNNFKEALSNPTNEDTHKYINQLAKINKYDNDFIQTTTFIATTSTQIYL